MCLDPDCSHPQTHWNQKGGTNETIHASVYARVRAVQQGKLLVIPGLDKQGKPKPYAGKETWDPKSLAMFRQPEHTTAYPCYFREATTDEPTELKVWKQKKGGQDISPNQFAWYGRCYKSKKFFQMYEEPDEGFKYPTMMSELKNSFSITAAKKDMEKNMRHWEILDDGFCLKEWREKPENKQEWEAYAKENLIDVKGGGWLSRLF